MRNHSHIHLRQPPIWLFMLSALLSPAARAGEFALMVNDVSLLTAPWPLVGSLPFPEGGITDASAIRIMSKGKEVPAQIDVTATWRDGSIRWALAGFSASPGAEYRVEYGPGVQRGPHPAPLHVSREAGGQLVVHTGSASYEFLPDRLLPERAWLDVGSRRTLILTDSGAGAYLVDNRGRTARVAGAAAEVTNRVLKEGPGRFVVHRTGWYVTEQGERLARAEAWFYFAAGSPNLRVTHSLILTEDTNQVWIRDYGLELRTPGGSDRAVCALGEPGREDLKTVAAEGREVFLLQDTYPHFAERESRAVIGRASGGQETVLEEFPAAGDWAHGDYGGYGLTVVMPWLAQRFPKEIAFGPEGARAVFWSGRSGRELDFRAKTLVEEYWQTWAQKSPRSPGAKILSAMPSNAQGAARTHDVWLLPSAGVYDQEAVCRTAATAARPPLALADPAWLCATEAYGLPMLHRDPKRLPREEALISEYWDRMVVPLRAFPMNGFIAWGCYPDRSYGEAGGRVMSNFHALASLREYGLRREPWRLYARSGERRYCEYGHRFSRFTGDWFLAHWDAPGKERGGFIKGPGRSNLPFFWGDKTDRYTINAGDIGHWLLDYYLTGDERSLGLVHLVRDSFNKRWSLEAAKRSTSILVLRTLVTLAMLDWDAKATRRARDLVRTMVDLASQNGVSLFKGHYGPMYKDHRTSHNLVEYYLETGDELARGAFLKLVDQRYRFDRRGATVSYKNYDGFTYSLAYWMTGDQRYRRVVEQTVRDALYYAQSLPLSGELENRPTNPQDWRNLFTPTRFPGPRRTFFLGHHEYHNPFIGLPTALKLLAEKGWSEETTPLVVKPMDVVPGRVLFAHGQGKSTALSLYFRTRRSEVKLAVSSYPDSPGANSVPGIGVEMEKRMPRGRWFADHPNAYPDPYDHYHARITVPEATPGGLYLLSLDGKESFTVLDATTNQVALYCPQGFWSFSVGHHSGSMSYGRSGEGMPAFFRVPKDLARLDILLGRPARVRAPDGSVAVEMSNEKIGTVSIPVEGRGGIWSIEPYIHTFRGACPPAFARLLNVEPIVAFGSPGNLPEGALGKSVPSPSKPKQEWGFVEGIAARALRLPGERALSFRRGKALAQGGYTFFPGATGTAEFWFKPDWSSHETPIEMTQYVDRSFLRGPHLRLIHRYWGIAYHRTVNATLRLELLAQKADAATTGAQGQHFFRAGEWVHIAHTWDIKQGTAAMEGDTAIFLNGRRLPPGRFQWYGLNKLAGQARFTLSTEGGDVVLGPFAGAMDVLRLSDTVRYREDFQPPHGAPQIDGHTRALFLFDGDLRGVSAFSEQLAELR